MDVALGLDPVLSERSPSREDGDRERDVVEPAPEGCSLDPEAEPRRLEEGEGCCRVSATSSRELDRFGEADMVVRAAYV